VTPPEKAENDLTSKHLAETQMISWELPTLLKVLLTALSKLLSFFLPQFPNCKAKGTGRYNSPFPFLSVSFLLQTKLFKASLIIRLADGGSKLSWSL